MAQSLWLLFLTLSIVLFTQRLVNGKRIHISPSTQPGTELLSLASEENTGYVLIFSQNAKILEEFLIINKVTGIVTLNREIKCGIFRNKVFVVTVRSTSIKRPIVHFWTPILVTLHNRHTCLLARKTYLNSNNAQQDKVSAYKNRESSLFNKPSGRAVSKEQLNDQLGSRNDLSEQLYKFYLRTKSGSKYFRNRLKRDVVETSGYQSQPERDYAIRIKRNARNSAPKFAKFSERVSVREDVNISTLVYTASATDTDSYLAGKLVYSMSPVSNILSQDFFKIDPSTGQIRTKALLDREEMAQHQFRVTAKDKGTPPLQDSMVLTIEVLDVNDQVPAFDKKVYRENISELTDSGTTVVVMRAYDTDEGQNKDIRYSIVNHIGKNEVFIIGETSGVIEVDDDLDRESVPSYHLVVKAQDQGKPPLSSTVDVFINLLDENDCTPQFNQSVYVFAVAENSVRGTLVGQLNATDCDIGLNQKIRYSIISGNDEQAFQVVMNSGVIHVQGSLDYETSLFYTLRVMAEDSGEVTESSEALVQIDVTDVNDCPPEFVKKEYQFNVAESTGPDIRVGTVEAIDCDSGNNGKIEYVLRDKNVPFKIGLSSGKIKTKGKLDRETVPRYRLEVIAQDKGKPALKNTATVYIDIDDINDSPPSFSKTIYNASIDEKYTSPKPFLFVVAQDKDTTGQIQYSIKDEPYNCFEINSNGGITKKRSCKLNYRSKKAYYFKVQASDGQQSSLVQIVVHVQDSNDNPPEFTESRYRGQIYENDTVGTIVLTVEATDDDFGKNAEITYSIRGRSTVFKINPKNGSITNLVKLDRELKRKYKLKVLATDNGKRKLSGMTRVDIIVQDINDNAPQFAKSLYEDELYENVRVGKLVRPMKATDDDEGSNKQISYTLEKKGN
jgi:hypothetical protein